MNIQHVGHKEKENTGNEYPTCRALGKKKIMIQQVSMD